MFICDDAVFRSLFPYTMVISSLSYSIAAAVFTMMADVCIRFSGGFVFNRKRNVVEIDIRQDLTARGGIRYVGPLTVTIQVSEKFTLLDSIQRETDVLDLVISSMTEGGHIHLNFVTVQLITYNLTATRLSILSANVFSWNVLTSSHSLRI